MTTRYHYIDALRGYAILGVILVHTHQAIEGLPEWFKKIAHQGARGVQLFFIVSALTLFLSLESKYHTEPRPILSFFIRRFFRIAPMFYLGVVFYCLLDGFNARYWAPDGISWPHILATITFIHEWYPSSITSVVPGSWTIGDEMFFYLFVPFFFMVIKNFKTAFVFTALAILLTFPLNHFAYDFYKPYFPAYLTKEFTFLWFPSQLPIFFMGFMLFYLLKKCTPGSKKTSISLVIISFAGFALHPANHFLFGMLFILFSLGLSLYENPVLINQGICFIGKISYSLYLVHFFAVRMLSPLLPGQGLSSFTILFLAVLSLSVVLATFTYSCIERPGMALGQKIIKKYILN